MGACVHQKDSKDSNGKNQTNCVQGHIDDEVEFRVSVISFLVQINNNNYGIYTNVEAQEYRKDVNVRVEKRQANNNNDSTKEYQSNVLDLFR